jgi:V8-like Glu-specific endopeptidase
MLRGPSARELGHAGKTLRKAHAPTVLEASSRAWATCREASKMKMPLQSRRAHRSSLQALACVSLLSTACSIATSTDEGAEAEDNLQSTSQAVLNGNLTKNSTYPAIGYVYSASDSSVAGTGTLIGSKYVLTAAHVVASRLSSPSSVQFVTFADGDANHNHVQKLYTVKSITIHPTYQRYLADPFQQRIWGQKEWLRPGVFDLAILELQTSVSGVTPMPLSQVEPGNQAAVKMAGYGMKSVNGGAPTPGPLGDLFSGSNVVASTSSAYLSTVFSQGTQIAYGRDAGGPLLSGGITAVHMGGPTEYHYDLATAYYTRLTPVKNWAPDVMRGVLGLSADAYEDQDRIPAYGNRKLGRPPISMNGHYSEPRSLHSTSDVDGLAFTLPYGPNTLYLEADGLTNGGPPISLQLYQDGKQVPLSSNGGTYPGEPEYLYTATVQNNLGSTFELLASRPGYTQDQYVLSVGWDKWVPRTDPYEITNNNYPDGNAPNLGIVYPGSKFGPFYGNCSAYDEDWVYFWVPEGITGIRVRTDPFNNDGTHNYDGDTVVTMRNADGSKVWEADDRPGSFYSTLEVPNMTSGHYWARVKAYGGSQVPFYALTVEPW